MITDAQTWLARALALTSGSAVSNSYDAGASTDIGRGRQVRAIAQVETTFTGGTSLEVQLVESANADLSSPTVLLSSGALAEAGLSAGKRILDVAVPKTSKKYVGFRFVNVGTHTAGKVDGLLVLDSESGDSAPYHTGLS